MEDSSTTDGVEEALRRSREEQEEVLKEEVRAPDRRTSAFKITKKALAKFGYSEICPGCRHAQDAPEPGEHTPESEESGGSYGE